MSSEKAPLPHADPDPQQLLAAAINVSTAATSRLDAARLVGQARRKLPAGHAALSFLDRAREAEGERRRELLREAMQACEEGSHHE